MALSTEDAARMAASAMFRGDARVEFDHTPDVTVLDEDGPDKGWAYVTARILVPAEAIETAKARY